MMASLASSSSSLNFGVHWHEASAGTGRGRVRGRRNMVSLRVRSSSLSDIRALLQAAHHTVDTYIKSGMVIGLGTGCASGLAIQYLGRKIRAGALEDIVGVPTCNKATQFIRKPFQHLILVGLRSITSASEAAKAGIPLDQHRASSQIDFAFDDADIIEEGTLVAVIGRQRSQDEGSILQEKSILNAANKLAFMVEENQYKGGLDGSVPVLVHSLNWMETAEEIDDLFLVDAEVWRRSSTGHAGPLGGDFPLVTREGHNVLDVFFTSPIRSLAEVAKSLDKVDGVVDHGVICKLPCTAVIASSDGLRIIDNHPTNAVEVP